MRILFIAKRRYTSKDTLRERFGRCYQLPWHWARMGASVRLVLLDYRGGDKEHVRDESLEIESWPVIRALTALRVPAADVVVASGDCFIGLLGLHAARRLGARFVFDVYDDYRTFGAYAAFCGWDAYGYLLARAGHAFYASRALGSLHNAPCAWTFAPNGIDEVLFQPAELHAARHRIGLAPAAGKWIGYFGGLDPARGINVLVDAMTRLRGHRPDLRLLVCGAHHRQARLTDDWIDYRGAIAHVEVATHMNACDVLALPYRRAPGLDSASSCKIAEYLCCQRPLAATATPNLCENFPEQAAQLGNRLAAPDDAADLARVLTLQLDEPVLASVPCDFTWRQIAARTLTVLDNPASPG